MLSVRQQRRMNVDHVRSEYCCQSYFNMCCISYFFFFFFDVLWRLANQLSVHYRHQLDWSVKHLIDEDDNQLKKRKEKKKQNIYFYTSDSPVYSYFFEILHYRTIYFNLF